MVFGWIYTSKAVKELTVQIIPEKQMTGDWTQESENLCRVINFP